MTTRPPGGELPVDVGPAAALQTPSAELAAAFTLALAAVHLFAGRLWPNHRFRERAVSAAGGASLAYVLVLVLPEVNEAVLDVVERRSGTAGFFGRDVEVYVVVLVGFLTFYAVHAHVSRAREETAADSATVFWAHVASFGAYNALIGYLLFHQERSGVAALGTYAFAMGLHFLVTDAGLRRHHGPTYDQVGRWVLAGAIVVGGALGGLTSVDEGALMVLFAFLSGAIVFNVMKEELPDPETSRFAAFVLGALGYTAVLLTL